MKPVQEFEFQYFNSDFASEVLSSIPLGKWIDKSVGGCGMSYLALTDTNNVIILSPRVSLIDNKCSQKELYPDLFPVYAGVGREEVIKYANTQLSSGRPIKIYATYNAFAAGKLDFVVDEFGCGIYVDESQFLLEFAEREPELCTNLHLKLESVLDRVSFFSAHPPKTAYMPEYIRNMSKIKYVWKNQTKATPLIINAQKPYWAVSNMLESLLKTGKCNLDGIVEFKKAIVFVNSVTAIKTIASSLNTDRTNIAYIVGDTTSNDYKLNEFGYRLQDPKNLPIITIGTTSMVSGIDLYDEEAITIVVSNVKKDYTMFDTELDVPQAITRQRIKSNPFKNRFIFILNKENMDSRIESLEDAYNKSLITIEKVVDNFNFLRSGSKDYSVFTEYSGYYVDKDGVFMVNEALILAKKYRFMELFTQYKEGYDVIGGTCSPIYITLNNVKAPEYAKYAKEILECESIKDRFAVLDTVHNSEWAEWLEYGIKNDKILINQKEAKSFYESRNDYKGIILAIRKMYQVGKFYLSSEVKEQLQELYDKKGLNRKAKSTDLYEFFEVESCSKRVDSSLVRGITIKSLK